MEITQETINVLFLLIPGLISARFMETVITRDSLDNFGKISEALVFSFVIYVLVDMAVEWQPLVTQQKQGESYQVSLIANTQVLAVTLLFSVVVPLVVGWFIHNDIHTKAFRWLKITDKTSRSTVWQDVYVSEKRHVLVVLKDGRRIYGWPMYYSHRPKESYLYLFQPAWVDDQGEFTECGTHGILISNSDIEFVEFMKKPGEDLSHYMENTTNE